MTISTCTELGSRNVPHDANVRLWTLFRKIETLGGYGKCHGKRHWKRHLRSVTEKTVMESVTQYMIYAESWKTSRKAAPAESLGKKPSRNASRMIYTASLNSVTESGTCDASWKKTSRKASWKASRKTRSTLHHGKAWRKAEPLERHENCHPSSIIEMRHGKRHGMCNVLIVKSLVWCKKIKGLVESSFGRSPCDDDIQECWKAKKLHSTYCCRSSKKAEFLMNDRKREKKQMTTVQNETKHHVITQHERRGVEMNQSGWSICLVCCRCTILLLQYWLDLLVVGKTSWVLRLIDNVQVVSECILSGDWLSWAWHNMLTSKYLLVIWLLWVWPNMLTSRHRAISCQRVQSIEIIRTYH